MALRSRRLTFTLKLNPEPAAAQELAAAICALPRMQGVTADPKAIKWRA